MQKKTLGRLIALAVCAASFSTLQAAESVHTGGLEGYKVGVKSPDLSRLEVVHQKMVAPPNVPEHSLIPPAKPRLVKVEMFIEEKEIEVEPGVFMWAFTFNGTVPGPMIVVHEGDYVELTLKNLASNTMVHNIDFHASTGAMGGGDLTLVSPGEEVVLRFKAIKPGVFIYHCAPGGINIPWHVVHGMNGAITVLPKEGLRDRDGKLLTYDKAYYIGEQDFYLPKNKDGEYIRFATPHESMPEDMEVMNRLVPTHVVFGDKKDNYTGDNALRAKVGERVMIYHSQANNDSSPHLIGGHGEYVWERGNLADPPMRNLESWHITAGSAGAALYTFKQPGAYNYLNHNLIKAVNLGASATFQVDGEWNNDLMEQVVPPRPIQ